MVGKTAHRTKADQARFDALKDMGCIAARLRGLGYVGPDIHHILSGGKRMGHQYTLPLSPWHNRGDIPEQCAGAKEAEAILGPSMYRSKRRFEAEFGTELELLEVVNGRLRLIPTAEP